MGRLGVQKVAYWLIWGILAIGVLGSWELVESEWGHGNICPKILGIPACYLIFSCFILAVISHSNLFRDRNWLYCIGVGTALSIATFGTVGQLIGYLECPKTDGGTPMCFLSFGIFASLLVLKLLGQKYNERIKK